MSKHASILTTLALVFISLAFTACDDDVEYYSSPLIGDWILVADEMGTVDTYQSTFQFYSDGSGVYTDYDDWGYEYTYNIYWETDGTLLYISFSDGSQADYQWSISGTTLTLTDLDTGNELTYQMY